ncbi:MAG: glycosyltransferase family 4 protein, partial [Candidatus Kariarchaeaceae archaeon]
EKGAKESMNNDQRESIVLYLGSIKQERGSRFMIEAFNQVFDQVPGAKLLLVGRFTPISHEVEIRKELDHRGLEGAVSITGAVQFEDIGEYLKQAAVGWIPWPNYTKHRKNIPTKVFEYMAYRVPVVSSDLPSVQPFVTHGLNGYLVTPDDPTAHANAIINLLKQPLTIIKMGNRGLDIVNNNYSWDEMEKRLLTFYKHVVEKN